MHGNNWRQSDLINPTDSIADLTARFGTRMPSTSSSGYQVLPFNTFRRPEPLNSSSGYLGDATLGLPSLLSNPTFSVPIPNTRHNVFVGPTASTHVSSNFCDYAPSCSYVHPSQPATSSTHLNDLYETPCGVFRNTRISTQSAGNLFEDPSNFVPNLSSNVGHSSTSHFISNGVNSFTSAPKVETTIRINSPNISCTIMGDRWSNHLNIRQQISNGYQSNTLEGSHRSASNIGHMSSANTGRMSSANTGRMSSANTGRMSSANTGHTMSSANTGRTMSSVNTGRTTSANTGRTTSANPGRSTSANPGRTTSANPGRTTSANPGRTTLANPGLMSSANPGRISSAIESGFGATSNRTRVFEDPVRSSSHYIEDLLRDPFENPTFGYDLFRSSSNLPQYNSSVPSARPANNDLLMIAPGYSSTPPPDGEDLYILSDDSDMASFGSALDLSDTMNDDFNFYINEATSPVYDISDFVNMQTLPVTNTRNSEVMPPKKVSHPAWAMDVDNFCPPPDEELVCSVCQTVFCDPVQTPCRHVFCRGCISKWLEKNRNCPICREATSPSELQEAVNVIKNLIMKLTLTCQNSEKGCEEIISLERYESHVAECRFETVKCKNWPCDMKVPKWSSSDHESNCPYRFRQFEAS